MKQAYITLITNENYLSGVLVLAHSLANTKTSIPFYVMLPKTAESAIVTALQSRNISMIFYEQSNETERTGSGYWKDTLAKLKVFDLTEFDKIVFIDADMFVRQNIDFLFAWPHMSAVAAGKELHPDWKRLNSGLMVIEPNHMDYLGLMGTIETAYQERAKENIPFGDQDVVNCYFKDWSEKPDLHLPAVLNVMLGYGGALKKKGIIRETSEIAVYHFTGKQKPWGKYKDLMLVLLKMVKRSVCLMPDLAIYREYRRLLKQERLHG